MGYNISALPQFTDESSRAFVLRAVLGAKTIDLLDNAGRFDGTAKGQQAVPLMNNNVTIQDGSTCGRNPIGDTILSEAILNVKPMKVNMNFCARSLESTYAVQDMKAKMKGQVYDSALFLDKIGEDVSNKISASLEQLIWNGDTTGSTASLQLIDGFLKKIKAGSYITLSGGTSGDTVSQLQAFHAAMPIAVSQSADYKVLVGQDTYNTYVAQMAGKNLFAGADNGKIFGTTADLVAVPGLNGTKAVVAASLENLYAGGEMQDVSLDNYYDRPSEQVFVDSRFSLGVVAIYIDQIGLGTIK